MVLFYNVWTKYKEIQLLFNSIINKQNYGIILQHTENVQLN